MRWAPARLLYTWPQLMAMPKYAHAAGLPVVFVIKFSYVKRAAYLCELYMLCLSELAKLEDLSYKPQP